MRGVKLAFMIALAGAASTATTAVDAQVRRPVYVSPYYGYARAYPYYYGPVYPYVPYPYVYYPVGPYSSTPAEAAMRGFSEVVRARAEAARAWSQALINYEEARSRYLENRQKWFETYLARKRIAEAYRAEREAKRRPIRRTAAARQRRAVPRLSASEVDFATGRLRWPKTLEGGEYAEHRRQLEEAFVLLAHTGSPAGLSEDAYSAVRAMRAELLTHIREMPTSEYIAARRFLEALAYAVKAPHLHNDFRVVPRSSEHDAPSADAVPELLKTLSSDDLVDRHEAILTLGRLGPEARDAVPVLIAVLRSDSTILRHSAIDALRMIGPEAKPASTELKRLLKSDDRLISVAAALALVQFDPDDRELQKAVLPLLIEALSDPSPHVHSDAMQALALIGPPAAETVSALLGRADAETSRSAADALAEMGPAAASTVPALVTATEHNDAEVRWHAARALGAIRARPELAVPALTRRLDDESEHVRAQAAYGLAAYGREARRAAAVLADRLSDPDPAVRLAAAHALGAIGPDAASAVPALVKSLESGDGAVTLNAADALVRIGAAAVPVLTRKLTDERLAPLAAHALGEIGPEARSSVSALVALLSGKDENTRREAILALANIGARAESAVPDLIRVLRTPADPLRVEAAYALASIDPNAAIPELRKTIAADDPMLRFASAWGLVHAAPDSREHMSLALPILSKALSDERPLVRAKAADALGRLGLRAKSTIPALIRASEDERADVRTAALAALGEVGSRDPSARAALQKALHDRDDAVRAAAEDALSRIGKRR